MERVGRNDPCPCGSGKKYKKCCGQGGPKKFTASVLTGQKAGMPSIFNRLQNVTQSIMSSASQTVDVQTLAHKVTKSPDKSTPLPATSHPLSPTENPNPHSDNL